MMKPKRRRKAASRVPNRPSHRDADGAKGELRLRHATIAPEFGRGKVHRPRLVDQLLAAIDRKLIVVAAPAGYGKTTLLADFAENAGMPVCWVRAYGGLAGANELAMAIRHSINRKFRRLKGKPQPGSLRGLGAKGLGRVMAETIELEIDRQFAIVIDDVHELNPHPDAMEFLDTFLENQPSNVVMLVGGREPPEVSLAKLMASGNLAGIGPQDLAVTRSEALEIAGLTDREDEALAERLLEYTRGWITGVVLARELAGKSKIMAVEESRPMVYEYLATVALGRLPAETREFMRGASVLRIMDADACDAILGLQVSGSILAGLVRQGVFVSASEGLPRTYEFHPLLREMLLEEMLRVEPRRLAMLRNKAAKYHEENGAVEDAFDLYLEAGSAARARRVADERCRRVFESGRWRTLEIWADKLRQANASSVQVLWLVAGGFVDKGRIEDAERVMGEIDGLMTPDVPRSLRGSIENLRATIEFKRGRFEDVLASVARAEELVKPTRDHSLQLGMAKRLTAMVASARGGDLLAVESIANEAVDHLDGAGEPYALAQALMDLFSYQLLAGKQLDATRTVSRARRLLDDVGSPLALSICIHNEGTLFHVRGRYEEAISRFEEAVRLARLAGSSTLEAQSLFGHADLLTDLRLFRNAAELYETGLNVAAASGVAEILAYGCLRTSDLHRRAGPTELAEGWLQRAEQLSGDAERLAASVRLERCAIEVHIDPVTAVSGLGELLEDKYGVLDAPERTLARFLHAYCLKVTDKSEQSLRQLTECMIQARATGTEQVIAGEVNCDGRLESFVGSDESSSLEIVRIQDRLAAMRAMERQFSGTPKPAEQVQDRLAVVALGSASLFLGGEEIRGMKPLHREILFYIVDQGSADKDEISELFWPEFTPGRQAANLHMAVYGLRRKIGRRAIAFDNRKYSIDSSLKVDYDVAEFEKAGKLALRLQAGDPRRYFALTEAISLYTGPFMEGSNSTWVYGRRRSLDETLVSLVQIYAEEAIRRANLAGALAAIDRALQIDPLHEELNLRYIEALSESGRKRELVTHYARFVQMNRDELGLDPSPRIQAAYSRAIG